MEWIVFSFFVASLFGTMTHWATRFASGEYDNEEVGALTSFVGYAVIGLIPPAALALAIGHWRVARMRLAKERAAAKKLEDERAARVLAAEGL